MTVLTRSGHLGWDATLNLNVRFDCLNTEICVTLLHEMLQMVDTRRNLLRAMLQKEEEILLLQY